jgi:pimeloyl-ACP methyl ester carboxylesterase
MVALGRTEMTLCGHSMGGPIAMALTGWHAERIRALAIIDS